MKIRRLKAWDGNRSFIERGNLAVSPFLSCSVSNQTTEIRMLPQILMSIYPTQKRIVTSKSHMTILGIDNFQHFILNLRSVFGHRRVFRHFRHLIRPDREPCRDTRKRIYHYPHYVMHNEVYFMSWMARTRAKKPRVHARQIWGAYADDHWARTNEKLWHRQILVIS